MNRTLRRILAATVAAAMALTLSGGAAVAKHDVVVELFYDGQWNNHTTDTRTRDSIEIVHGVANEARGLRPSQATLTFTTRDGATLNPANIRSPLYGKIGRGTLLRITIDGSVRFVGRTYSWKPRRAIKGDSWVHVQAGGVLQQLGEGRDPLEDTLTRWLLTANPAAWWPLDDPADATSARSNVEGIAALRPSGQSRYFQPGGGSIPVPAAGAPKFGVGDMGPRFARKFVSLTGAGELEGKLSLIDGGYRVEMTLQFPLAARADVSDFLASAFLQLLRIDFAASDVETLELSFSVPSDPGFNPTVRWFPASGPASVQADWYAWDGLPHRYRIDLVQDGADLNITFAIDGVEVDSSIETSTTLGTVSGVLINRLDKAGDLMPAIADLTIWDNVTDPPSSAIDSTEAARSYAGEPAGDRFTRLCGEEGITATVVGTASDTQLMGPQYPDTMLNQLAEIARTDNALIFDTRDQLGLTMRTGRSLYNQ